MLVFRVRLMNPADAALFFGAYSEALEMKYDKRTNLMRRPNYFSFDTPADGVFLRCIDTDCLVLEGGTRTLFDRLTKEIGWPAGPAMPARPNDPHVDVTQLRIPAWLIADAGRSMKPTAQ